MKKIIRKICQLAYVKMLQNQNQEMMNQMKEKKVRKECKIKGYLYKKEVKVSLQVNQKVKKNYTKLEPLVEVPI